MLYFTFKNLQSKVYRMTMVKTSSDGSLHESLQFQKKILNFRNSNTNIVNSMPTKCSPNLNGQLFLDKLKINKKLL